MKKIKLVISKNINWFWKNVCDLIIRWVIKCNEKCRKFVRRRIIVIKVVIIGINKRKFVKELWFLKIGFCK